MINIFEVKETNNMVEHENLDVRTITIGISLLSCINSDLKKLNENIYNRITSVAKDLAKVAGEIEAEYGIPIVNKRISVTPIALIGGAACKTPEDFATIADTMDRAAEAIGADLIGGYSALVSKGMTKADEMLIRSIPIALCRTNRVCSSVNLASTKTGINMDAVRLMGEILLEVAERSKDRDSVDCMKLVVFCNAPDDNPFMAGAFHGVTEADAVINVGVSGPGVVKTALEKVRGENFEVLCETIKKTAFKVTRVGQLVAQEASRRLSIPFGIIDLSLAPTPAIGDSVADILCEIGLEYAGAPGTTAALAMLNDQVKKGGVMASSYVGGLSGAFIPVTDGERRQRSALAAQHLSGRGLGSLQMGHHAAVRRGGAPAERRLAGQAERRLSARQVSSAVCRRLGKRRSGHRRWRGADGRRLSLSQSAAGAGRQPERQVRRLGVAS